MSTKTPTFIDFDFTSNTGPDRELDDLMEDLEDASVNEVVRSLVSAAAEEDKDSDSLPRIRVRWATEGEVLGLFGEEPFRDTAQWTAFYDEGEFHCVETMGDVEFSMTPVAIASRVREDGLIESEVTFFVDFIQYEAQTHYKSRYSHARGLWV